MEVKLALLLSCLIAISYCSRSNIPSRSDVTNEHEMCAGMTSEVRSIRQLLMNLIQEQNRQRKVCPPGFDYLPEGESCYRVIFHKMTWNDATERCRQVMPGVHLAAITSQQENNAIVRYLQSQFRVDNSSCFNTRWPSTGNLVWIGGQTRNANRCGDPFVWKPLRGIEIPFNYTNWGFNNPDCHLSKENCAQIVTGRNNTWNDNDCDALFCAICELHV